MDENSQKIEQLLQKIDILSRRQQGFYQEINDLRREVSALKQEQKETEIPVSHGMAESSQKAAKDSGASAYIYKTGQPKSSVPFFDMIRTDAEKFIGENLINKIGIIITVIGVAIGAKYSIDHELISPLARIILGYLVGIGLIGFGIRLKDKYKNYSAVLVSGAIAIFYFITYSAYAFYALIPQSLAFAMMALFTVFGVVTAFAYNLQVIAHIGLVGAYAVPFLVGGKSGNVTVLLSYIALIDLGILLIGVKKYWKPLYYSSFIFTWLIFLSWFMNKYREADHFGVSLFFVTLFFLIFYLIFLDYKLRRKEKFDAGDILLLIFNSFIFFGCGYFTLKSRTSAEQLLGLFTLMSAVIHFTVGWIIYRQKLTDRNLFYFTAGLVLVFVTMAIPIQLNGNWVTLVWGGEAALLFWIGRSKRVWMYEKLSYPLIVIAFFSLVQDWILLYYYNPEVPGSRIIPLWNIHFLTSLILVGGFLFINYIHQKNPFQPANLAQANVKSFVNFVLPGILLISLYFSFKMEISSYWNQLFTDSVIKVKNSSYWDNDLPLMKYIWGLNYSLLFLSLLSMINNWKLKSNTLGKICMGLSAYVIFIFLTRGLFTLGELRESYLGGELNKYYLHDFWHIGIRYISYLFAGLTFYSLYNTTKQEFLNNTLHLGKPFEMFLAVSCIWILSSEWINVMDILRSTESYKLGLSILWGILSLVLVIIGIWKRKSHLRIGAIVLFAVTLLKLFFYDISHLDTIAKTIVFVSLGILLLIISFLYNKYRHLIFSAK